MNFSSDDLIQLSLLLESIVTMQEGLSTTLAILERIQTVLEQIESNALPTCHLLQLLGQYGATALAKIEAEAMAGE
jgi:hypothetical protein